MVNIKQLSELTKNFTVLYAEDDDAVASQMVQILKELFREVYYAPNGKDGYVQFLKHDPDIIITDIKMPEADGIVMSTNIRQNSPEKPIIITSAYDDSSFLHSAIEIGVSAFISKPISQKNLFNTISSVCTNLQNKNLAEAFRKMEMKASLNAKEYSAISTLIDTIDTPIVLAKDEDVFYFNSSFSEFFSMASLENFLKIKTVAYINSFLIDRAGFITDIGSMEVGQIAKVMIKNGDKAFFYEVKKKHMFINDDSDKVYLYMLYDITSIETQRIMIEYQKNKLENLNCLMSEMFYKGISRKQADVTIEEPSATKPAQTGKLYDSVGVFDKLLDEDEMAILKKSHTVKTSALDYTADIGKEIADEILELKDTEIEIASFVDSFEYLKAKEDLDSAMHALKNYASRINMLVEFGDLAAATRGVADFVLGLPSEKVESQEKKIVMYITNIMNDLSEWRENIFEKKSTADIHYLDASLFSSCLQLQFELSEHADDSDDIGLELF